MKLVLIVGFYLMKYDITRIWIINQFESQCYFCRIFKKVQYALAEEDNDPYKAGKMYSVDSGSYYKHYFCSEQCMNCWILRQNG